MRRGANGKGEHVKRGYFTKREYNRFGLAHGHRLLLLLALGLTGPALVQLRLKLTPSASTRHRDSVSGCHDLYVVREKQSRRTAYIRDHHGRRRTSYDHDYDGQQSTQLWD
jgi:hypothetical protein